MKTIVLKANITAEHLSPQDYNHLKYMVEKELNRHGIKVEVYDYDK